MPDEAAGATAWEPETLAGRIALLRELTTPKGEQPLSYEKLAVRIEEETGVKMSGAHIFNMAKGLQPNPKISHVHALARFFRVPVGYLVGDGGDYRRLEAEVELLGALKRGGVTQISLEGDPDAVADLSTVRAVLRQLDKLTVVGDARAREIMVNLAALEDEQRRVTEQIIADPALLRSLQQESARAAARRLGGLSSSQLASLEVLLEDPQVLDALGSEGVPEVAALVAGLSAKSREAVLAVIGQLHPSGSNLTEG